MARKTSAELMRTLRWIGWVDEASYLESALATLHLTKGCWPERQRIR
jgi:hypothetical protein